MRWILASLVLINIAAFIYFQFLSRDIKNDSVVAMDTVPGGQSLRLLSEVGAVSGRKPARDKVAEGLQPKKAVCTLVGAFDRLLKAEYFAERLSAVGLSSEVKELVVASKPGYWLHLKPEPSRKEALRRLSELQRRGIDSYVIPSGELANGISLGMFSKKESAVTLHAKIKSQGYDPHITNIEREQKEIWVLLSQGEAARLSPERWADLLSTEQYLQRRQNFCSDIASA